MQVLNGMTFVSQRLSFGGLSKFQNELVYGKVKEYRVCSVSLIQ